MITSTESGTNVVEIADGVYRINTPVDIGAGRFSFNQYLIVDDEPLLFHTGLRRMFPSVCEAVKSVIPVDRLRYVGFSHYEADECGSLNEFLSVAPHAVPLCSRIAAMTSINDIADRAPRVMANEELLALGKHTVRWLDTPHVPHGWESGVLVDEFTKTLFCGDLFTQPGAGKEALTESDVFAPSEGLRSKMNYFVESSNSRLVLEGLANHQPTTLACMHGSAWRGDGKSLLLQLSKAIKVNN